MEACTERNMGSLSAAMCVLDRHRALIVMGLMDGTKRFGELKKELGGVTQKTLAANLRLLEKYGLLTRRVYAEVPPKVEYTLTDAGYELRAVLEALAAWGGEYLESE